MPNGTMPVNPTNPIDPDGVPHSGGGGNLPPPTDYLLLVSSIVVGSGASIVAFLMHCYGASALALVSVLLEAIALFRLRHGQ
jgi:hypothetical protein